MSAEKIEALVERWNPLIIALGFVFAFIILIFLAIFWPFAAVIAPGESENLSLKIYGWLLLINFLIFLPAIFFRKLKVAAMLTLVVSVIGFEIFQVI